MPEIAEVRINYDILAKAFKKNRNLMDIKILDGRYKKKKPEGFTAFKKSLPAKVKEIVPRGKHIWILFDNGWRIWIGFGMSGKITLDPDYDYIRIELIVGHDRAHTTDQQSIYFSDMRNFANWYFWAPGDDTGFQKQLEKFGPDLLENKNWSKTQVVDRFRQWNQWDISKALMDQRVISGTGNYLRAEGLYLSRIYPLAKVSDLSDANLYTLFKNIVKVAEEAYKVQSDWQDPDRPYTDFQDFMKVYNQDKDPQGRKVVKTKDKNSRMIHWVPEVQTIGKKT